ncbi:hypothetical protein LRS73_24885 [Methylobacterium currus]|uniref:hypothetical protein n=1 Tax=Methylobacterium currus TaxID=2051553 RepID=UPI001E5A5A71|nr:hypothetical protein [Methylobacterium currus]UHC15701.1 hypothetical protein LRS73_24885 [Methylobacterium currus]
MRDGLRRSVGLALLLGILCAPPTRAQGAAAPRPWSDPPTKPAEAPPVTEAAKPVEPAAATPARTASKPARIASRPRKVERPALARRKAEQRERVASRPIRRPVAEAPSRRVVAFRTPSEPRPVRAARPLPPDMAGYRAGYRDVDLWIDARADRIRRARDGGLLVMRRTTIEDPMGRQMQILHPVEDEDE